MTTKVVGEKMIFGGRFKRKIDEEFAARFYNLDRTYQLGRREEQSIIVRDYFDSGCVWRINHNSVKVFSGEEEAGRTGVIKDEHTTVQAMVEGGAEVVISWRPTNRKEY